MSSSDGEDTLLLRAMKAGDKAAAEKLLPLVYSELHRVARLYMLRERNDHTLQPTALINEAYMRLANNTVDWQSRQHFIAVAANMMRRVLVDHARAHNAGIRGGGAPHVEFEEEHIVSPERSSELIALDGALDKLEKLNPRQAKVVELRYFAGLSVEQIGSILEVSPRSVKRDWALARIWLYKEIQSSEDVHS